MAERKTKKKTSSFRIGKVLKKRIDLPVGGALGRNVREPKWLAAIRGYFVGSWLELREVQWTNRRSSISLTLAVVVFTLIIVAFTFAIDSGFEQLFKGVIIK